MAINTETGVMGEFVQFEVFLRGDFVTGTALMRQQGEFNQRDEEYISEIHLFPRQNQYEDNLPPETLTLLEKQRIYEAIFDAYDDLKMKLEERGG